MRRLLKWLGIILALALVALIGPVIGTELLCHGTVTPRNYQPILTDAAEQRPAANSYMTYPEWHIVYAYEGLAETLKNGDEYQFAYFPSVIGFWKAECQLLQAADAHGGADFDTRSTSYVIGPSFGLELAFKALYEDTLGAVFALLRGAQKTPQDEVARDMAAGYAAFLQQTPWYEYDFAAPIAALWAAPVTDPVRGWERRLALTGEWKAKIAYAQGIKSLVAATTGDANLEIFSVVSGLSRDELAAIKDVQVMREVPQGLVIKTPRYAAYTAILVEIARRGGEVIEIAGNDSILITTLHEPGVVADFGPNAQRIITLDREGFYEERDLMDVKVARLAGILRQLQSGPVRLEHVYDY
ncbi:hypothetical protein [Aestuariivirga litoralis]|uniref:hypothetical protein n=1 Tax=Aestuariivirga litoralis TaxID=2650924 RepID=UPI0018C618BC|nr:hypothetical protein [Aestuariivirga litoralis]MBG1232563.1 hypothetical protein [Aestuariivirga litoralis]